MNEVGNGRSVAKERATPRNEILILPLRLFVYSEFWILIAPDSWFLNSDFCLLLSVAGTAYRNDMGRQFDIQGFAGAGPV